MVIYDITDEGVGYLPPPINGPALRYHPLPKEDVDAIAVHHMTGEGPSATATADQEIAFLMMVDDYHRTGRGLDGIGYQLVPCATGRVYLTARLDRYGAHVGGQNNHLIGIGLPGDYTTAPPPSRHLAATVDAVRYVYEYLGRDVPTRPHLYWGGTACPGAAFAPLVPGLQEQAKEDIMAKLDDEDREYIAKMLLGAVRAIVNGNPFGPRLAVDASYTEPERSLKDVIQAIATSSSGGLTAQQITAAVKQALKEGTG